MSEPITNIPVAKGRKTRKNSKSTSTNVKSRKKSLPKIIKETSSPLVESPKPISPGEMDTLADTAASIAIIAISNIQSIPYISQQMLIESANMMNLPVEIFASICEHLPPSDLLSLTLVCKKFKDLLCGGIESPIAQSIWKTSREKFLCYLQLSPPSDMGEKEYIVLRQLEKGCQFCHGHGTGFIKVYWEFRVRCCEMCLDRRTMRRDTLYICYCVPEEVLNTLPFILRGASHVYWLKDVCIAMEEFSNIGEDEVDRWMELRQGFSDKIMTDAIRHEQEEHNEQISKLEERMERVYSMANDMQHHVIHRPINFVPMGLPNSLMFPNSVQQLPHHYNRPQYLIPQFPGTSLPYNQSQFLVAQQNQQFYPQFMPCVNRQMITPQCFGISQVHRF